MTFIGTPGGVGFRLDPRVFLEPGDTVQVEIEGIGAIENSIVAESISPSGRGEQH